MIYFLWFSVIALSGVLILLLLRRYTTLEFVQHAKLLWQTWSVWFGTFGAALTALMLSFPDAVINMWLMLPPDIKGMLPPVVVKLIGPFLMVMGVMSQFVKQRKLAGKSDE